MKTNRRILFARCAMAIGMTLAAATSADASITKVGNGDDGGDLEALTPIASGPIWESRLRAVDKLKQLSVMGVPGLSLLLPELERTDLLMAAQDVHPTIEPAGSIEITEDSRLVYARTFAEPYAATRFFPVAMQLTPEQLVALHIHEALHRSLPTDVRGNEDVVMHMTMAMTSPGASFDRVRKVASLYVKPALVAEPTPPVPAPAPSIVALSPLRQTTFPAKARTRIAYDVDVYDEQKLGLDRSQMIHGFEFKNSLGGFQVLRGYAIEPTFRARVKVSTRTGINSFVGPSSYDLQGRLPLDENSFLTPFVRFTAKALDDSAYLNNDRDVITLGALYQTENEGKYLGSTLSYSLPSSTQQWNSTTHFKSIVSLTGRTGFIWGRFRLGGVAELHASNGKETNSSGNETNSDSYYRNSSYHGDETRRTDSFRILVAGPEVGYVGNRLQLKAYCKWIMNDTAANLTDLGDIVDRGADRGGFGTSIAMEF